MHASKTKQGALRYGQLFCALISFAVSSQPKLVQALVYRGGVSTCTLELGVYCCKGVVAECSRKSRMCACLDALLCAHYNTGTDTVTGAT